MGRSKRNARTLSHLRCPHARTCMPTRPHICSRMPPLPCSHAFTLTCRTPAYYHQPARTLLPNCLAHITPTCAYRIIAAWLYMKTHVGEICEGWRDSCGLARSVWADKIRVIHVGDMRAAMIFYKAKDGIVSIAAVETFAYWWFFSYITLSPTHIQTNMPLVLI
ncbi:hypothetical protein BC938DRAFT_473416 [Jimgerdemannia flammicorona]|uniref:Uncharacterized protein n=1 Tax=Jimgerdemannia flammicorona TaxID=994334 RepID=A0A433Q4F7_9FUNG|nr:hypothetical protein BC938DRAFT_473416 [Jimgerdemannia flammicorona]